MTKTIDFCIPFIAAGIEYVEYLVQNLYATAKQPQRVRLLLSYHTEQDKTALLTSSFSARIHALVHAQPFDKNFLFYTSANHSRAINALTCQASADIVVFSDYDMAFSYEEWDTLLEDYFFCQNMDVCGVTYPSRQLNYSHPHLLQHMPWLDKTYLLKYQKLPNLSFFCIRQDVLQNVFHQKMTAFDEFLSSGCLPFRIINTPAMAAANHLHLGCVQWLDTGWEIPALIQERGLKYEIFPFTDLSAQKVLRDTAAFNQLPPLLQPEFFNLNASDTPFLCHYKKGSAKSQSGGYENLFQTFCSNINQYLAQKP